MAQEKVETSPKVSATSHASTTMLDKYLAGLVLFCIIITILGGLSANVSINTILYRCFSITIGLLVISFLIKKYCVLLVNFKNIFEELDKDSSKGR
ncbi:MAG: hypothetical protein LBE20_02370 [Deltaproteobacteria bacterium]|jgi:hypothetical protein|nr:hypothetical protein [Deltaproteobacteria bacterium]